MANNRMYLVNKRTGIRIYIAKYYPSTGWFPVGNIRDNLCKGFEDSDFGYLSKEERSKKFQGMLYGEPYANPDVQRTWVVEYEEEE